MTSVLFALGRYACPGLLEKKPEGGWARSLVELLDEPDGVTSAAVPRVRFGFGFGCGCGFGLGLGLGFGLGFGSGFGLGVRVHRRSGGAT